MKSFAAQLAHFLRTDTSRQNLRTLARLLGVLAVIVAVYSFVFHLLMLREGREHSWVTGIYWTLTTMSTLGFGDITFSSDLGRVYSICVLLTGTVYMLILLPFSFIRFFYAPWMEAHAESRALRQVPARTTGHVVLTNHDAVTTTLINKLTQYGYTYVLLVPNLSEALRLHDSGFKVVMGDLDNPDVYRKLQVENAAMVATTGSDPVNTHVAFTVRELTTSVPIIATADDPASVDILELAGCTLVLEIPKMLGQALARRLHGGDARAHVIGRYGELLIAETTATGTPMVGKTLMEIGLRRELGLTVVAVWERGEFKTALPKTTVSANTVLVLAGTREQLERFNEKYRVYKFSEAPTLIIGGGRVGRATAQALAERGLDSRIVEQNPELARESDKFVVGSAAELTVLQEGGHRTSPCGDRHHPRRRHERLPDHLLSPPAARYPDYQPGCTRAQHPQPAPSRRRLRDVLRVDGSQRRLQLYGARQHADDRGGPRRVQGQDARRAGRQDDRRIRHSPQDAMHGHRHRAQRKDAGQSGPDAAATRRRRIDPHRQRQRRAPLPRDVCERAGVTRVNSRRTARSRCRDSR